MGQLYTVTVQFDLPVWADSEAEAKDVGLRSARDESLCSAVITATPTTSLPKGWENALPHGREDDQTCKMLMADCKKGQ